MMAIDRRALERLRELVGGDQSDVIDLVNSFFEEGPDLMAALEKSMRNSDLPATRRAAHSMKSNARDMGAIDLAEICARLEARSAQGERPDEADVENAKLAFQAAVAELQDIFHLGEQT